RSRLVSSSTSCSSADSSTAGAADGGTDRLTCSCGPSRKAIRGVGSTGAGGSLSFFLPPAAAGARDSRARNNSGSANGRAGLIGQVLGLGGSGQRRGPTTSPAPSRNWIRRSGARPVKETWPDRGGAGRPDLL